MENHNGQQSNLHRTVLWLSAKFQFVLYLECKHTECYVWIENKLRSYLLLVATNHLLHTLSNKGVCCSAMYFVGIDRSHSKNQWKIQTKMKIILYIHYCDYIHSKLLLARGVAVFLPLALVLSLSLYLCL